ncbi:hypothetical protein ABW636_06370 [Aquimarina sp. 2201CG1-2-11]|uniref:fibronectin type III domain-containing protein n=1 Tax=Aquimarina discodermiae TaxID=3231043 RepID=UPI003462942F
MNRVIVFCFLWCCLNSFSQGLQNDVPEIKVLARVQTGKVLLRWAPTSPSAWMKNNTYGYTIERYTIKKEGKLISPPSKKVLLESILKPDPIETWEKAVNENDYAAVLAQALYGESFLVEEMQQGALAQIINTSKEIEQRFSFALFAADMDFEMAKKAALGYEDTSVVAGEEYLYRIKSLVPNDLLEVKMGSVVANTVDMEPLPKPIDLIAVPDDKSILITWEYEMFKSVFTSYYIERSENGTDFKRLGDTPLLNLNDKPGSPAKRMYYVDTLSQNNTTYHYRVQGISPFGEVSPFSETVSAQGIKKLSAVPHIKTYKFDTSGGVDLFWEFPKEAEKEITEFELNWAPQEKGPYKTIQSNIPSSTRKTNYKLVEPSNYFKISAKGKSNQKTTSLSAFVQTIDSIPPAAPVGVVGVVDTLGVVNLKWEANTERDMLGYRVFRGNLENEEVSQLTVSPIERTTFVDTVQIKSLNSKVYYQIVAVDQRFNMSEYSEKLALKKPDVVPPSSPIFSSYKVKPDGIFVAWINSSSDDVETHQLYRQNVEEAKKGWQLIFKTDTIINYLDKKVTSNIKYRYAIFAEDDSGLKSAPSTPLTISNQNMGEEDLIKGFTAIADRENKNILVSWRKMPDEVVEVVLYKSKKDEKPVLWKQIPSTITKLVDATVHPGSVYVYIMKVILSSGQYPKIKEVEVTY